MKKLIISSLLIIAIFLSWFIFVYNISSQMDALSGTCAHDILPNVCNEKWNVATVQIQKAKESWNSIKKTAAFFLDEDKLQEINSSMTKSIMFIRARDVSNGSGEILSLSEQIKDLNNIISLKFHNIF